MAFIRFFGFILFVFFVQVQIMLFSVSDSGHSSATGWACLHEVLQVETMSPLGNVATFLRHWSRTKGRWLHFSSCCRPHMTFTFIHLADTYNKNDSQVVFKQ